MCGIVGYIGFRRACERVLEGLQRLEYRGYDSSGVAVLDHEGQLAVQKAAAWPGSRRLLPRGCPTVPSVSVTPAGQPTERQPMVMPIRISVVAAPTGRGIPLRWSTTA